MLMYEDACRKSHCRGDGSCDPEDSSHQRSDGVSQKKEETHPRKVGDSRTHHRKDNSDEQCGQILDTQTTFHLVNSCRLTAGVERNPRPGGAGTLAWTVPTKGAESAGGGFPFERGLARLRAAIVRVGQLRPLAPTAGRRYQKCSHHWNYRKSAALLTPAPPWLSTWVYIIVMLTSEQRPIAPSTPSPGSPKHKKRREVLK